MKLQAKHDMYKRLRQMVRRYRSRPNFRNTAMMVSIIRKYSDVSDYTWSRASFETISDEFERLLNETQTDG